MSIGFNKYLKTAMAIRSAILIDNFLPQDIFDNISAEIADSPGYTSGNSKIM